MSDIVNSNDDELQVDETIEVPDVESPEVDTSEVEAEGGRAVIQQGTSDAEEVQDPEQAARETLDDEPGPDADERRI